MIYLILNIKICKNTGDDLVISNKINTFAIALQK